jgi:uncharacterized membrane protein
MSNRDDAKTRSVRDQKRAQFSNNGGVASTGKNLLLGLVVAAVGIAGYFVAGNLKGQATAAKPVLATPDPSSVTIPVTELDSGQAKFYEYKTADNRDVRFFVMKSSDGVYRSALDTCDVCYRAKKGYIQQGDDMICRKCGRHFPSRKINEVEGGCNPVGLPLTVADGKVVIAASDLEAGKSYF